MKTHLLVFLVVFAVTIAAAQSVTIGTNAYPLAFEDTALPAANRERLAADLTEAFAFAPSLDYLVATNNADNGKQPLRDLPEIGAYTENLLYEFVSVSNSPGVKTVIVGKGLSDDHARRLALLGQHEPSIVQLKEKIALLNSGDFTNLALQAKLDMIWPPNTVPSGLTEADRRAASQFVDSLFSGHVFFAPSIFRLQPGTTFSAGSASVRCLCVAMPKEGFPPMGCAVSVGLVDGRWRFFLMDL